MVDILQEKVINKQSRWVFSGSSIDMDWEHQTRVQTVETHRYKGTQAEVEAYLDATGESNTVMRKSDGPYWETDVITTTNTAWQTES